MTSFLAPYKLLIEIAVIGALAAGAIWGVHSFLMSEQKVGYDRAVAEYQANRLIAEQAARKTEQDLRTQLEVAQNAATQREQVIRSTTAASSSASASLRDAIASIRSSLPTDTVEALRNTAATLSTLFGDCQSRYRGMAEIADRHASDARTLSEAWPK